MKTLFIYTTLLLIIGLGFFACDSTISPDPIFKDEPAITNFSISPNNIQFSPDEDGIKDTTIQVSFEATAVNLEDGQGIDLRFYDRIRERTFNESMVGSGNTFTFNYEFETKTTFFEEFMVNANIQAANNDNYAQGQIKLSGFSLEPPQILSAENVEELQRPSPGQNDKAVGFFAKVSDLEGNDTIEGVFIRLISRETGEIAGSPFNLFDNGSNGDQVAKDSTYTVGFRFGSDNQLQTYDVLYYAKDKGGLISDTVKTTFSIVE